MKTITRTALVVAALGLVAVPVLAQQNAPANPPPAATDTAKNDDGGGWWPWGRKHGRDGGCDERRGGGHHGRGEGRGWGDGQGRGMGRGMGRGEGGGMPRMMGMIDANSDGVIGDDEAAERVENVFMAMDSDTNEVLTMEEYMAVRMGPGADEEGKNKARMDEMQQAKKDRFVAMDADKDGNVTKADFLAAGKARFMEADADKDGKVTPWEFRAMRRN